MRTTEWAPMVLATLLIGTALSGCGGGSEDPDSASPGLDAFTGSWSPVEWACELDTEVSRDGQQLHLGFANFQSYSRVDGYSLRSERRYYASSDCSGTPLATHAHRIVLTQDGSRNVSGREVRLVSYRVDPIGGPSSPDPLLVNGIAYPGDYFSRSETGKGIDVLIDEDWFINLSRGAAEHPLHYSESPALRRRR